MSFAEACGLVATILTLAGFAPYYAGILKGSFRPHVFSWVIWGATTLLVFFAQLAAGAGLGAWPVGLSGVATLGIAALAWVRRHEASITRLDVVFLVAAFSSLPAWFLAGDPLWAVIVLTVVDLLGFGPTIRQVHRDPWSESVLFYLLFALRNAFVLGALAVVDLATALFPVAVGAGCLALVGQVLWRRTVVERPR